MVRHLNWLARLEAALAAARGRPFQWGRHDCCLFPCDVVRALTGVDLARGLRGRYRSLRAALRLLEARGGVEALAVEVARRHGISGVHPALARRGDVVLVDAARAAGGVRFELGPGGPVCLGIVGMDGASALVVGREGLVEAPMALWRRAWRIG